MKDLKDKAIQIKGKDYVLVADRVSFFNEEYKNGMIECQLLSELNADTVVMRAKVTPDVDKPNRYFSGYSQAKWGEGFINKTSALENCETSAVGRALGMMGIGVIDSIASADEINKANNTTVQVEYKKEDVELIDAVLQRFPDDKFVKSVAENFKKSGELSEKQVIALNDKLEMANDFDIKDVR